MRKEEALYRAEHQISQLEKNRRLLRRPVR
jgi:hypothetical protein